jgi:hypothetical protein
MVNLSGDVRNKDIFTGTFFGTVGYMFAKGLFKTIGCIVIAILLPTICFACMYITLTLMSSAATDLSKYETQLDAQTR